MEKNFWEHLAANEITPFMDLVDLSERILGRKVAEISFLAGGLTNKSFKIVYDDGKKVVMRLAGAGTGEYIDRSAEKYNATKMGGLGIAPEVYFFDEKTGSQISEFIELPTCHLEDFQKNKDVVSKAAKLVRMYHTSGIQFKGAMDPVQGIKDYVKILEDKGFDERYEGWDEIYATVLKIAAAYEKNPPALGPCHNDVLAENFMYDGTTMKLIDWEYGGQNDPYYDAAGPLTENEMDDEMTEVWLTSYFGGEPTEEERARVMVNRFLYCTYWSVWSLVQMANGKEREIYWDYGLVRAKLGKAYMSDPKFADYLAIISK